MLELKGNIKCHFWGDGEWDEILHITETENAPYFVQFKGWINNIDPNFQRSSNVIGRIFPKGSDFLINFILIGDDEGKYYHIAAYRSQTRKAKGHWSDNENNSGYFILDFTEPGSEEQQYKLIAPIDNINEDEWWFSETIESVEQSFDDWVRETEFWKRKENG
jgi:hypothetical protein